MKNLISLLSIIVFFAGIALAQPPEACKKRLPETINSFQPAILPVTNLDGDKLYFTRKNSPQNVGEVDDADDVWLSERGADGSWALPKNDFDFNTSASNNLFWISPDSRYALVYTDKFSKDSTGEFVKMIDRGGRFEFREKLRIKNFYNNDRNYFACASFDFKTLIFAINRDDSVGGLDLYFSELDRSTGEYSEPALMGLKINTPYDEGAPYLSFDSKTLYFYSFRKGGAGKSDLWVSRREDDTWTNWSAPENLGERINSPENDYGVWLSALGDSATIVSHDSKAGRAGLYSVCLPYEFQPLPYGVLGGEMFEIRSGRPYNIDKALKIVARDRKGRVYESYSNPENGSYRAALPTDEDYDVRVYHPNYETLEFKTNTFALNKPTFIEKDLVFDGNYRTLTELTVANFENDVDMLTIEETDKILAAIDSLENPDGVRFLVKGHADETGSSAYNYELSLRRANTVVDLINEAGIPLSRIDFEAYGESMPISADRADNRRVEIYIVD